jgi:hypothetical protein
MDSRNYILTAIETENHRNQNSAGLIDTANYKMLSPISHSTELNDNGFLPKLYLIASDTQMSTVPGSAPDADPYYSATTQRPRADQAVLYSGQSYNFGSDASRSTTCTHKSLLDKEATKIEGTALFALVAVPTAELIGRTVLKMKQDFPVTKAVYRGAAAIIGTAGKFAYREGAKFAPVVIKLARENPRAAVIAGGITAVAAGVGMYEASRKLCEQ